ncbi:TolC family protein [Persephonella sp.]
MVYRYILALLLSIYTVSYSETIEEIINYVLENSPQLKAYQYEAKTVEGNIKSAEALPNPELYLEFGRLYSQSEGGFNVTELSIYQPLKLWGIRKNAIEEAILKKNAFETLFNYRKRELLGEVYKGFYKALYYKEILKIKEKELKLANSVYRFVKSSYELGEDTRLNLYRAEKDLKLAQIELKQAEADYKTQLKTLSYLVGKDIKNVSGELTKLKEIPEININDLPEIKYLNNLIKSIDKSIEVQKGLSKPQLGIQFTAGEDAAELGKYEFGIGISATLPVFYRNQGEILKLVYQKRSYISNLKQKKLMYSSKFQSIKNKYSALNSQLKDIDTEIIPSLSKALSLGEKSFKLRAITLFELSDIRKQYIQALLYRAKVLYELHTTYGEYIKLGGLK